MKTKIFKLNNGITGVIVPIPGLKSVTVEAFLKIGSKYELKNEFGMSHFLEHMAFKGTVKRPTASIINKEIDSRGANYNAGTGHEMTSYYITTIKENIPWAIEMVADILTNSIYDETEVLKERGVIMEEIKMYQDNPMMGLSGEITKFLYGKSKIGCWNIAGEVSDIEDVNRQKVVNFRNKFINPKEMVVVVAGNVDLEASNEIEKYFSSLTNKLNLDLPEVKVILGKQKQKNIRRKMEQGHFAMAVPGVTWQDKRKYAFKLLDIVLNGSSSSRLYQKIREDNALAYYVFSISESFAETGFWGVQSGVKLEKIDEAMDIVRQELKTVADNLKEDELKRAKDYLIGKTELVMDRTDYWSNFVGERLLLEKKMETIEDELNRYRKVELKELKSLAGEIFKEQEIRQVCIRK
jgi:predicted Zn-dependent peptidase